MWIAFSWLAFIFFFYLLFYFYRMSTFFISVLSENGEISQMWTTVILIAVSIMLTMSLINDNLYVQILVVVLRITNTFYFFEPNLVRFYNVLFYFIQIMPFVLAIFASSIITYLV